MGFGISPARCKLDNARIFADLEGNGTSSPAITINQLLLLNNWTRNRNETRVLEECQLASMVKEEEVLTNRVPQSLHARWEANFSTIADADRKEHWKTQRWVEGVVPWPTVRLGEDGGWVVCPHLAARMDHCSLQRRREIDTHVLWEVEAYKKLLDGAGISGRGILWSHSFRVALIFGLLLKCKFPLCKLVFRWMDHVPQAVSGFHWDRPSSFGPCRENVASSCSEGYHERTHLSHIVGTETTNFTPCGTIDNTKSGKVLVGRVQTQRLDLDVGVGSWELIERSCGALLSLANHMLLRS